MAEPQTDADEAENLHVYYLAYGSNCNVFQMRHRCPTAEPIGTTTLPGYELRFSYHADVMEKAGASVICAVWKLMPDDVAELDMYEGYPSYYIKKFVEVDIPDVGRTKALLYEMSPHRERALQPPAPSYAECIREGYRDFGIPETQMTSAPGFQAVEETIKENQMPDSLAPARGKVYFFAYDNLTNSDVMMSMFPQAKEVGVGQLNNHALEFRSLANAVPVVEGGGGTVRGVVWQIDAADLSRLDTHYEVRHGNFRRDSDTIEVLSKGMFGTRRKSIPVSFFVMTEEARELRPHLATPNRRYKTDIVNAFKARPELPEAQLAAAPGWTASTMSYQEMPMIDLRQRARRRARDAAATPAAPTEKAAEPLNELFGFGGSAYYFAYGANTNTNKFMSRCPSAKKVGVGMLKDWEMEFRSVANISRAPNASVFGLVWKISKTDLERLDRYEGVGDGSYDRHLVKAKVKTPTGPRMIDTYIYVMTEESKGYRGHAGPKETYRHTMQTGYAANGLPVAQIASAVGFNLPENPDQQQPIRKQREARQAERRGRDTETRSASKRLRDEPPGEDTPAPTAPVSESSMRALIALVEQKQR